MCAHHLAEVVEHLVDVVDQLVRPAGHTDDKVIEIDLRNSFNAGSPYKDASVCRRSKPQTCELCFSSSERPVQLRIQTEIADAKFIHGRCTESLRHAKVYVVRPPSAVDRESRIEGRISRPVRVDAIVPVKIVVGSQQPEA